MSPSATFNDPPLINGDTTVNGKSVASSQHKVVDPDNDALTSHSKATAYKYHQYKNPSLYVTPDHNIRLEESPIPKPSPTQVLIHVRASGICGSDLHLWHRGAIGPLIVDHTHVLGHEASGVILETGSAVTHLKPGDRIAIEPQLPCHTCFLCTSGKYNLCESVQFLGVCNGGTIRRFMIHEAQYCHKIPDTMTFSQASLLEPLSVILHAIRQCKGSISIGKPVLICGAGPIGLIALATARASGAWPLVITDVEESRLEAAKKLVPGAKTYVVQTSKTPLQCSEEIRLLFGCAGGRNVEKGIPDENEYNAPPTVLECTGIESSVITAAYACRRSGVVMVVGVGRSVMNNLPFMHLSLAEIELKFINRYNDTWPAGINALANGQVLNLDPLVTHTFPLERAREAMELCADRSKGSIKVQIVDDQEIQP
jgi:L-iditol 2-dehydrogenase